MKCPVQVSYIRAQLPNNDCKNYIDSNFNMTVQHCSVLFEHFSQIIHSLLSIVVYRFPEMREIKRTKKYA